tara:strand:- start:282 stop:461 length:180 start_codon:yes stop_codon:yes gene_type:complete
MTTLNKLETWEVETLIEDRLNRLHRRCEERNTLEERREFYKYYAKDFEVLEKILDKCQS